MDSLDLIRAFREVALRGSFSKAAVPLALSKASVSKYVAELESRLKVRLLNRSTRTVSLTDAGALLLERSAPLIEMMTITQNELSERAEQPGGRLRLSAPHGLGATSLPHVLSSFMQRYPAVTLSLHLSNRMVDLVELGIDVALRVGTIDDSNLIVRRLRRVEFCVCATPAYWDRHGRPTHPDDLARHDALTYSLQSAQPYWRFQVNGQPHTVALRSRLEATDAAPLISVALQGLGVVCLPRLILQPQLEAGTLEQVLEQHSQQDVWLYAAYSQRRHNSAAMRALLAHLEETWGTARG